MHGSPVNMPVNLPVHLGTYGILHNGPVGIPLYFVYMNMYTHEMSHFQKREVGWPTVLHEATGHETMSRYSRGNAIMSPHYLVLERVSACRPATLSSGDPLACSYTNCPRSLSVPQYPLLPRARSLAATPAEGSTHAKRTLTLKRNTRRTVAKPACAFQGDSVSSLSSSLNGSFLYSNWCASLYPYKISRDAELSANAPFCACSAVATPNWLRWSPTARVQSHPHRDTPTDRREA